MEEIKYNLTSYARGSKYEFVKVKYKNKDIAAKYSAKFLRTEKWVSFLAFLAKVRLGKVPPEMEVE